MMDYSWVTQEMFDAKLEEIVNDELGQAQSSFKALMTISTDIYELLKEKFNNEVLNELEDDYREAARRG